MTEPLQLTDIGITPRKAAQFASKGIETVQDLLMFFPTKYLDFRNPINLAEGKNYAGKHVAVKGQVVGTRVINGKHFMLRLSDGKNYCSVFWFNQAYRQRQFYGGQVLAIGGIATWSDEYKSLTISAPDFASEDLTSAFCIKPIYRKIKGMSDEYLIDAINLALPYARKCIKDPLNEQQRNALRVPELARAVRMAHTPQDETDIMLSRRRQAVDVLYPFCYGLEVKKAEAAKTSPFCIKNAAEVVKRAQAVLPFALTEDQHKDAYDQAVKNRNNGQAILNGDQAAPMHCVILNGSLVPNLKFSTNDDGRLCVSLRELAEAYDTNTEFDDVAHLLTVPTIYGECIYIPTKGALHNISKYFEISNSDKTFVFTNRNTCELWKDTFTLADDDDMVMPIEDIARIFGWDFWYNDNILSVVTDSLDDTNEEKGAILTMSMFVVLDFVWTKIKEDRKKRKAVFIDECWKLIGTDSNEMAAEDVVEIFRTIRAYGGSAFAMTQDISQFYEYKGGKYGKAIIGNADTKIIMHLIPSEAQALQAAIQLTDAEMENVSSLQRGQGLVCSSSAKLFVDFVAADYEKQEITTDAKSFYMQEKALKEKQHQEEQARLEAEDKEKPAKTDDNNKEH